MCVPAPPAAGGAVNLGSAGPRACKVGRRLLHGSRSIDLQHTHLPTCTSHARLELGAAEDARACMMHLQQLLLTGLITVTVCNVFDAEKETLSHRSNLHTLRRRIHSVSPIRDSPSLRSPPPPTPEPSIYKCAPLFYFELWSSTHGRKVAVSASRRQPPSPSASRTRSLLSHLNSVPLARNGTAPPPRLPPSLHLLSLRV